MRYFIAVLLLSGVLFVPAANASSCPGADPCPWTKIDSFGDVGIGEFRAPLGVAADAAGNVYVLEQDANRVQKLNSSGSSLAVWGSIGSSDGELHEPSDIAIDPTTASVYVTDQDNNRIERFDTAGKFVAIWGWGVADGSAAYQVCTSDCRAGTSGSGPGQTSAPAGVATDGTTVYVAEWSNKRIEKFDLDGGFAGQWPIPGGEHPARVDEHQAVAGRHRGDVGERRREQDVTGQPLARTGRHRQPDRQLLAGEHPLRQVAQRAQGSRDATCPARRGTPRS